MKSTISNDIIKKWGLPRSVWIKAARRANKVFQAPFSRDNPEECILGKSYWDHYPLTDFDYSFNSWGARDRDFESLYGQKINICLGDSFTSNVGGPVEHSWPYQLGKYFDIPTLNFGLSRTSFVYYPELLEKAKEFFDVQHVFVLQNLYEDNNVESRIKLTKTGAGVHAGIDGTIVSFKKNYWIHGAHTQFLPPWTFREDELKCIYEHFPDVHDYMKLVKTDFRDININSFLSSEFLLEKYNHNAGESWMPYMEFCKLCVMGENVYKHFQPCDHRLITIFLGYAKRILLCNRDGYHMSERVNAAIAKYFYMQVQQGIIP